MGIPYRKKGFYSEYEKEESYVLGEKKRLPSCDLCVICDPQAFPGGSAGKESTCNVGDLGSIPGVGGTPGEGNSYPLQYSGLENSMDSIVHGGRKDLCYI